METIDCLNHVTNPIDYEKARAILTQDALLAAVSALENLDGEHNENAKHMCLAILVQGNAAGGNPYWTLTGECDVAVFG